MKKAFPGVLVVLLAGCGGGGGGGSSGPQNLAPLAVVGASTQNVLVGSTVTLDGRGSRDPDSAVPLRYTWTLAAPAGSAAALSAADAPLPVFAADVAGTYTAKLVVNDGKADSEPATVTVVAKAGNVAPVASAGSDQVVRVGSTVTLDGSGSRDANGDALGYAWGFVQRPDGSGATLSNTGAVRPTFVADKAGSYVVGLRVGDNTQNSELTLVTVTAVAAGVNLPPVAVAGADRTVLVGTAVQLDGGASRDPDGAIAVWNWKLVSQPEGSALTVAGANTRTPSFTPATPGSYVLHLAISDSGGAISAPSPLVVTAVPTDLQLARVESQDSSGSPRTQLPLPYTASAGKKVEEGCTGCPAQHVVAAFELKALTEARTVTGLDAQNIGAGADPTFDGLVEGQTIPAGGSVTFRLIAPLTGGQPQDLRWRFDVGGKVFDYSVQLRTN